MGLDEVTEHRESGDQAGGDLAVIQAIVELRHPHLIVMNPSGDAFDAELMGGTTLAELRKRASGPPSLRVSLRILLDMLSGLAALHNAELDGMPLGFAHGGVTPSCIVVGRDGIGRLIPLEASHWATPMHDASELSGHAAPEKLLGDSFDHRADVFSAGVLLWEAITGRDLFAGLTVDAIVTQLIGGRIAAPIPPGEALWDPSLGEVALRALAVDPAERWAHVGVLGAQIETIAEGHVASSDEVASFVTGASLNNKPSSSLTPTVASTRPGMPRAPEPAPTEIPASVRTSWSGTAPFEPTGDSLHSRRGRAALIWSAVSLSLMAGAFSMYHLLGQRDVSSSTATVLAPAPVLASETAGSPSAHLPNDAPPAPLPSPETRAPVVPDSSLVFAVPRASGSASAALLPPPASRIKPPRAPRPKPKEKEDPFGI